MSRKEGQRIKRERPNTNHKTTIQIIKKTTPKAIDTPHKPKQHRVRILIARSYTKR